MQLAQIQPGVPITHGTLGSILSHYRRPNDKISRLMRSGEMVQLKRGLYLRSDPATMPSLGLIANHLLGPSYVSLDFALQYHGLIPEAVLEVSSVTTRRAKTFKTPLGHFVYIHAAEDWYRPGLSLATTEGNLNYLIASPEKALCDKIAFTPRLNVASVQRMQQYLFDDLRIDEANVAEFDLQVIEACAQTGTKQRSLRALLTVLKWVQQA